MGQDGAPKELGRRHSHWPSCGLRVEAEKRNKGFARLHSVKASELAAPVWPSGVCGRLEVASVWGPCVSETVSGRCCSSAPICSSLRLWLPFKYEFYAKFGTFASSRASQLCSRVPQSRVAGAGEWPMGRTLKQGEEELPPERAGRHWRGPAAIGAQRSVKDWSCLQ